MGDPNRTSVRQSKKLEIETECNDVFFLLVWAIATIYVISVASTWGDKALDQDELLDDLGETLALTDSKTQMIYDLMLKEMGIAAALSLPTLVILMFAAEYLIWAAIILAVCMNLLVGGLLSKYLFGTGDADDYYWVPAVCFGAFAFFLAAWAYCVRARIAFAGSSLGVSCKAILEQPMLFVIAFLALGFQLAWIAVGILALLGADEQASSDEGQAFAILGHILILLWGVYVFKYILHVVVSDSVGDWWDNTNAPGSTVKSLLDTCTLRLGSICFGSLLVALLGTIKSLFDFLAYESKSQGNCVLYAFYCCFSMIANCLDSIMKLFNRYTFSYVGIYGYGYLHAGEEVLGLFNNRGWTSIINDQLIENVLWVASVMVAILTGLIGVEIVKDDDEFTALSGPYAIAFFQGCACGYFMATTLFSVVSAGATAVLVLFAEDDEILRLHHREEFDRLDAAWREIYPNEYQKKVDGRSGESKV